MGSALGIVVVVGIALYVTEEAVERLPVVHAEPSAEWADQFPNASLAPQAIQPVLRPVPSGIEQYRREPRRLPYPPGATAIHGDRMVYEGRNTAAFGYKTHNRTRTLVWDPGRRHGGYPNLIAGQAEQTWLPATGFQWANRIPQSPIVEPISREAR